MAKRKRGVVVSHKQRCDLIEDRKAMKWNLSVLEGRILLSEQLIKKDYWTIAEVESRADFKERLRKNKDQCFRLILDCQGDRKPRLWCGDNVIKTYSKHAVSYQGKPLSDAILICQVLKIGGIKFVLEIQESDGSVRYYDGKD